MIQLGNVVTLDNEKEYLILEEVEYENQRYVLTVRTENQENITDESMIFRVVNENGEEYLEDVDDKALCDTLTELFKDAVAEKIDNMEFPEEYNDLQATQETAE